MRFRIRAKMGTMEIPEQIRELRPHATWDIVREFIREGLKMMLPFLAGLGIREWVHQYATALMWTAAVTVAAIIAYWDRIPHRRSSAGHAAPHADAKESVGLPKLEIVSVRTNDTVAFTQEIFGTATPGIPVELRVFAGGVWHGQRPAEIAAGKWQAICQFGNAESPAGGRYRLIALSPDRRLPDKLAEIPADIPQSEVISVVRSTPPIDTPSKANFQAWYERPPDGKQIIGFKVARDSPAVNIRKVGPLVSEETYRTEIDLSLHRSVFADIEPGRSIECGFSGNLIAQLEAGGPLAIDMIQIQFSEAGKTEVFNKSFFVHKNIDGTVVFSQEQPKIKTGDLRDLRNRVNLGRLSVRELPTIGFARLLGDEGVSLAQRLNQIHTEALADNDSKAMDALAHPLSGALFGLHPKDEPWTWYMKSIWRFQCLYSEYGNRATRWLMPNKLTRKIPDEAVTLSELQAEMRDHCNALIKYSADQESVYAALA